MNKPNNSREKLYARLKDDGYDLVDFDTFSKKLDEESSRKSLYDQMTSAGYDLGGYDEYTRKIVGSPFKQNNSVAPTPSEKPEEEKVQLSFTTPQRPQLQSLQVEQKEYPTIAETTQKKMAEGVAQRQQLSDMTTSVQRSLNRRGAELDEAQKANTQSYIPQGTAGSIPAFDAGRMYDPEYRDYAAAKESLQKAQAIIDAVGKEAEDKEKGHAGLGGFFKGAQRGFDESVIDWNTWTAGLKDTSEGLAILKALDAAEEGTLTESQQALLDAKAIEIATSQAYSSSLGRGYKAGQVTAESIPFMIEFALNPIARTGNTVAKKFARYALDRFGKESAKKNVGKYVAGKALAQVATDALKAGAISATTGAGRTAADALQRMQGDIYYQPNEEGKVAFWKREGGEDATTAFKKAYANTTIENFSEMLGNYFAPIGKAAGIGVSKGLSKIGLEGVNQMLRDVKANDLAQLVSDFEKRAQWNGTIGEFGEEVAGNILNSIIVGDQTLDAQEGTGVFNKENLIDTYLGVALLGGIFSTAKTIDYPLYKYHSQKDIRNAQLDFDDAFGKDEEVAKINEALTSDDPRIAGEALRNIIGNETYARDQQMAAAILAKTVQKYKGAKLFDEKMRNDPETPVEKVEVADSYDKGRNIATPQEKNDALNDLEAHEANIRQRYGLDPDAEVNEFMGGDPIAFAMNEQDTELRSEVLDFVNAKAVYDGLTDGINERIAHTIEESDRLIDSHVNKDDNLIHTATLKGVDENSDRKVYIISGAFARNEDGTIDTTDLAEGASIIVKDATTGKSEFIDPRNLKDIAEAIDPAEEKQRAAETITDEIATKEEAEIAGTLAFVPNDIYTIADENGAEHTATIVADNQDGNVQVILDNAQEPMLLSKEKVQQMADAYNIGRANAKIAEKKAQSTVADSSSEVKPSIPTDEQGKPIYEQAPVEATWAELLSLNDGNAEEAIDTAKIMRDNAKKALDKANKSASAKGDTVEAIQQAKAERKALIDAAQAKYDYWDNVANYQASQPQKVAEPTTAEEQTPIVENASFDENINEIEQVYNEESNERSTENADVPASVSAEDGIADGDQTSIEMVQGTGTDNTLGDSGSSEEQGSNEGNVGEGVADVPTADVSGAEEVDNGYNGQEADISDEDIEALWIKSRDELWKPDDETGQILHEKLYEAHPEEHQPEDRKKVVRHLIEAAEKYKDHPIAKEVLKYVKYPQTTSMRVSPLTNREEMRRKPLRARAKMWEAKVGVPVHLIETFEEVPTEDARKAILDGEVVTAWVTDGEVYLYMPYLRNRTEVDKTYIHEVVAHVGMKRLLGKEGYRQFCMRVYNEVMTEADREFYDAYPNVKDHAQAADEYIAHLSETTDMESTVWQKVVRIFRDALRVLGIETALTNKDIQDLLRDSYQNLTNEENVADIDEESGQAMFSIRTYDEGGRAKLVDFLNGRVKDNALTQAEADEVLTSIDDIRQVAEKYRNKYAPFGAWSDAKVVENKDGKPAFSVIRKNGEYTMNLDFSTVCKKRRTLDAVFSTMIDRGLMETLPMDGEQIAEINNIIRKHGFETACALCFVDAKRFRVAQVADKFCEMWNTMARMNDRQLKATVKAEKNKSVRQKVAMYLLENPEERVELKRENLIDSRGFEEITINKPEVLSLYKQAQGTSLAKIPYGDVQYMNDIENSNWTPDKAYAVGGVRLQSFSDYVPRMFFDYMQMMAGLAAKQMPVHAYTKEPIFAKQFGLTGMKINLSLVPKVVDGGVAAGLDADGNYAWMEGETFPYDEAIALQNAEGYRENCGTIAVGVSDEHILKMLDDPNIRMVIPYHKSGLNPLVAKKNRISEFTDYTNVQNTRSADGGKLGTKALKDMPNFNALMHEGMDARQAAQAYLDWCDANGFLPKFDKFRNHPNYYKLLEDFTTIVPDANGVETIYPQGAVSMTFPTEEGAFGSIESLIREGLEEDAILEGRRDENVEKIVDTIEEELVNFRFIGEVGASNLDKAEEATTRLDNLAIAREMEAADKSAMTIKMATGWERGADGKWRYEVDDNITAKMIRGLKGAGLKKIHEARSKHIKDLDKYAYITNVVGIDRLYDDKDILATTWPDAQKKNWLDIYNIYKDNREAAIEDYKKARTQITRLTSFGKGEFMLYEVLGEDHSLFKEYPQLKQVKLFVKPYKGSAHMGGYNRLSNTIDIVDYRGVFENDKGEGTANTLVHEIQHVIQGIEGFARGGNMSMEDTRKVKTKEAEVAYYTEMYEDAVKERRDLADQARVLNEKMYTWWNEHPDATWEEALRESDMYEWNKAYSGLQDKIKEAQDRVELYERNLEEVEDMDTSLGLEGYKRLAGEVEARNVERRRNMSLGERRNSPAWRTEDVSRKDQIFIEDALGEANAQFRIVYHGSGAEFDKFDNSFMGTGVGNQFFGWGTYVTEDENGARAYAQIHPLFYNKRLERSKLRREQSRLSENMPFLKGEALKKATRELEKIKKALTSLSNEANRYLYSVEIPDNDGTNYLEYGKPLSKTQLDSIKQALYNRLVASTYKGAEQELKEELDDVFAIEKELDGGDIYGTIGTYLGSDKAASQFLNENGYVGIIYTADGGDAGKARNYVIFNEADLDIADSVRFRISDYDNQFADLQSEYDALDKNDEKALNEWREKKVDVVESYLYGVADNFGMKPEIAIFNGADEQQMREAYDRLEEAFRRNGATPPSYEAFKEHALDKDVFATYYRGGDIITNNLSTIDYINDKMQYAANLFHEVAHHHAHVLYNAKELKEIWDDVKGSNLPLVEKLNTARLYKDKSDASKGNEFIAHSIGALVREYKPLFQQFLRGENNVTADDVVKKLNYKKTKANFAVTEILNRIKDEYQESRSRVGGNISEGIGGSRPNRVPKRVLQGDVPEQNGGRRVRERGGRLVLDSLLNDVAQRGLREMVGEDAYNAFLMRAVRDLDESTRRAIMENGMRNGLNFHDAAEEYLASLAEQDNVDEAYLSKVNALVKGMLQNAGIEVGDISNNELRYMLWRSHLQYDGIFSLAEDVVMRNRLGVGNYTQEADVRPRYTDSEAKETSFRIREQEPPKNTGIGYKVFVLKDGKLYPPMVANPDGAETPVGVWLDADAAPISGTSKTGRSQVKAGGKGTQGGSGSLAYRPGWHLGSIPYALQFNRKNPDTGERELFPNNFVWAEVDYANDVDYQEEAMSYGYNKNGKFQHSYAGLPRVPENGAYIYRTNPNPETDPWVITGAMKVNRLLTPSEVDEMVIAAGRTPQLRQEGAVTDADVGQFNEENGLTDTSFRVTEREQIIADAKANGTFLKAPNGKDTNLTPDQWVTVRTDAFKKWFGDWENDPANASQIVDANGEPKVVYHRTPNEFTIFDTEKIGASTDWGAFGMGFYFSPNSEQYGLYGSNEMALFLNARNPLMLDNSNAYDVKEPFFKDGSWNKKASEDFTKWVKDNGYDAVVYKSVFDEEDIAFSPNQIKSADGNTTFDANNDDIRFRVKDEPTTPSTGKARQMYDEAVRSHTKKNNVKKSENLWHHLREAYQDSMLSVQKLMDAVLAETGNTLRSSDDVYKAENQLSSKNKAEIEKWERDFMKPLQIEILDLIKKGASYEDIVEYLLAKHGLERNLEFSRREDEEDGKVWDGFVKRDFSGLTELTGEAEHFTEAAQQIVEEFEDKYNTDNLWSKINAATKESLKKSYDSGLMSKETYDKVANMFQYYIPLRGWDNNVAADQYEYMANKGMKIMPALKTAKGRTSRADDPIATLGSVGESSIIQGNRNLMKQKFLNFAQNNPTSLLTVDEQWYEQNADGTWKPSNPEIPTDATADEVDAIIKAHEAKMEALGDKATKKRQGLNINLHTTKWEEEEHAVNVKRNGKEYKIYVNGNPIAAQAINGFTNPNANKKDSWEWIEQRATAVKNFMARAFTSMNPAFVLSNLARDIIWAGTSVAIKENADYARQYSKNISNAMLTAQLPKLVSKWKKGTLDMNDPIEKYFHEFITNGGETGFTQLNTVDDYKRNMERFIKEAQGGVTTKAKKGWRWIWDNVEFLNRSAEDTTRFMVYLTSRQMGRPISESIANAKDITVNFNKKGRGTMGANVLGFAYIFFNATIQSLANFGKLIANHPKKTTTALTLLGASGMITPMVALTLQAMLSGDDDEPTYWDLPEWVRRNNIVIYVGGSGYVTIPLPHELRPFYGMGELAFSTLMGKEEPEVALQKAVEGFAGLMPFDFTGNAGNAIVNFTPTIAQPLVQLAVNKDYFGTPIYRKTAFNEQDPEWTKAYKSTNQLLVDATEFLNELTGGDEVKNGLIDLNPAVIEHLYEGYLGGMGKTINRAAKTFSMLWDEDARTWRNVPVASSFYQVSDERTSGSQVNREYFDAVDEADAIEHLYSGYRKRAKMGVEEYAEKLNELIESDAFKRYQKVNSYKKAIAKMNTVLKEADPTDREDIETRIMELKVDMLEELDAMDIK